MLWSTSWSTSQSSESVTELWLTDEAQFQLWEVTYLSLSLRNAFHWSFLLLNWLFLSFLKFSYLGCETLAPGLSQKSSFENGCFRSFPLQCLASTTLLKLKGCSRCVCVCLLPPLPTLKGSLVLLVSSFKPSHSSRQEQPPSGPLTFLLSSGFPA